MGGNTVLTQTQIKTECEILISIVYGPNFALKVTLKYYIIFATTAFSQID